MSEPEIDLTMFHYYRWAMRPKPVPSDEDDPTERESGKESK